MRTEWRSERCLYSYLVPNDLPDVVAMLSKESVTRGMFFEPDPEKTMEYHRPIAEGIEMAMAEERLPDVHSFVIRSLETGEFMGECAMEPIDHHPGSFIIGYQLDEPFWRKGFGTEACEFIIFYAFEVAGARRLMGDCQSNNPASRRIMEKCDMRYEGIQREYHLKRGIPYDRYIFGLLRSDVSDERLASLREKFNGN